MQVYYHPGDPQSHQFPPPMPLAIFVVNVVVLVCQDTPGGSHVFGAVSP